MIRGWAVLDDLSSIVARVIVVSHGIIVETIERILLIMRLQCLLVGLDPAVSL